MNGTSTIASRGAVRGGVLLLLVLAGALGAAGCKENPDLRRLINLDDRAAVGAPPQSVEELKAGIEKYSKEADRKVEADEKVGLYYKILASRYTEKKMYGEAYEAYVKAIEYAPTSPALYHGAGLCAGFVAKSKQALGEAGAAERRSWLSRSESSYKVALEYAPRFGQALYGLAVLYEFELERPADALPLLRRLLEIETKNVDALLLLGRVYYRLGRFEDAINAYETVVGITKVADKRKAAEENIARVKAELGAR